MSLIKPLTNYLFPEKLLFSLLIFLFCLNVDAEKKRRYEFKYRVDNNSKVSKKGVKVAFYLPFDRMNYSYLCSHGYEELSDKLGNRMLKVTLPIVAAHSSETLHVRISLGDQRTSKKKSTENLSEFLKDEKYIEKNTIDLPRTIQAEGAVNTAEQIYKWIRKNIKRAEYEPNDLGAAWALDKRSGDCSEQAYLFVALCRKAGIPARFVEGYFIGKEEKLQLGAFHNWAEFWNGDEWVLSDPHAGFFQENYGYYLTTRVLNDSMKDIMKNTHRFRVIEGDVKMRMIE